MKGKDGDFFDVLSFVYQYKDESRMPVQGVQKSEKETALRAFADLS